MKDRSIAVFPGGGPAHALHAPTPPETGAVLSFRRVGLDPAAC